MNAQTMLLVLTVAETVRDLREVPSGHLYAALLPNVPNLSATDYQLVVDSLKRCKLIEEKSHLLRWVGREFQS